MLSICHTLFKGLTHPIFNSYRVGTIIILNLHIRKQRHREISDLFHIIGKTKIRMYMYIILVTLLNRYIKSAHQTPICSPSSETSSFLLAFLFVFQFLHHVIWVGAAAMFLDTLSPCFQSTLLFYPPSISWLQYISKHYLRFSVFSLDKTRSSLLGQMISA